MTRTRDRAKDVRFCVIFTLDKQWMKWMDSLNNLPIQIVFFFRLRYFRLNSSCNIVNKSRYFVFSLSLVQFAKCGSSSTADKLHEKNTRFFFQLKKKRRGTWIKKKLQTLPFQVQTFCVILNIIICKLYSFVCLNMCKSSESIEQ